MRTWHIYETIYPLIGDAYRDYVGQVEAKTEASALRKASKEFRVDRGGVPARGRKPENFIAR